MCQRRMDLLQLSVNPITPRKDSDTMLGGFQPGSSLELFIGIPVHLVQQWEGHYNLILSPLLYPPSFPPRN